MFNFRNRLGMLACAAALSVAASAHAETFDFSYVFSDGQTITGSVDGNLVGSVVEDLTNLHVVYDGVDFGSSLVATSWDAATSSFTSAAQLSANSALNNFYITDTTGTYAFSSLDDGSGSGVQIFASNQNLVTNNAAYDLPVNATWSVTAVPEPATTALLLAGVGVIALCSRRRRAA